MEKRDRNDLRTAVILLEKPSRGIRLINLLGYPIEGMINALPRGIGRAIGYMASKAVGTAFHVALSTINKKSHGRPVRWVHRTMVLVSGAVGGFFGLPGLIIDLPVSTTLMLRSIAEIARSEGEDLSSFDTRLACITVFALGGRSKSDNAAETAYYAVRAALTRALSEAAEFIARTGNCRGRHAARDPADSESGFPLWCHRHGQGGRRNGADLWSIRGCVDQSYFLSITFRLPPAAISPFAALEKIRKRIYKKRI